MRYSSSGKVTLKYIMLPGINDNEEDIDGFIALCKAAGTSYVQISYDINAPEAVGRNKQGGGIFYWQAVRKRADAPGAFR
jgi:adenine C2-methylase RlmN of 23S rRNA A2503 and tRNA A37